nr:hypothetical protein [Lentinula edodes]UZS78134.1 hypothetical protein [Lentinula edodes]
MKITFFCKIFNIYFIWPCPLHPYQPCIPLPSIANLPQFLPLASSVWRRAPSISTVRSVSPYDGSLPTYYILVLHNTYYKIRTTYYVLRTTFAWGRVGNASLRCDGGKG